MLIVAERESRLNYRGINYRCTTERLLQLRTCRIERRIKRRGNQQGEYLLCLGRRLVERGGFKSIQISTLIITTDSV